MTRKNTPLWILTVFIVFIFLMGTVCGVSAETAQTEDDYQALTLENLLDLRDTKYHELELINQAISAKTSEMRKKPDDAQQQQTVTSIDEQKTYSGLERKGDYQYSWDAEGNIKLVNYYWDNFNKGDDIVIPDYIDGHPVTVIGTQCFSGEGSKSVGTLVIPDTISIIEYQAIDDVTINHISLPQNVEKICHGAFIANFKSISIDKRNENYTVVDNALYEKKTKTLIAVSHAGTTILDGIKTIGAYACYFVEPEDTKMSVIPDSVTDIEEHAFCKAKILINHSDASYYIPAIKIGEYAFSRCRIWCDSIDKVELKFNSSLTEIPSHCFSLASTKSRKYVKYWDKSQFKYVTTQDFYNCTCSLQLPESLVRIGDYAFKSFSTTMNNFTNDEFGTIEIKDGFPKNLKLIGEHSFEKKGKVVISSPNAFEKNENLTSIGSYAFSDATLKIADQKTNEMTFVLPLNLIVIGESAFNIQGDSDFYTFQLPASVSQIGKDAFDKSKVILKVEPESYSEKWAVENAYRYESNQDVDLSWLE